MRKNKGLYIGIAIVLVVAIAGGAFFFMKKKSAKKPEDTLNAYVELLNSKDYEAMYDLISSDSKDNISKDDFVTRNKNIYEGIEAQNVEVEVSEASKDGDEIVITYTTDMNTAAGDISFQNSIKAVKDKESKEYKLVWNSQAIFPELGDSDKVRITTKKATRGSILDRNKNALAKDGTAAEVGIVPGKLTNKEQSIKTIAEILGISTDAINNKLGASYVKDDMFVPIKVISANDSRVTQLLSISGIMVNDKQSRVYPLGSIAAHLTGYVQSINAEELEARKGQNYNQNSVLGKAGLEKLYEEKLRGIDGAEIFITDKLGKKKATIVTREVKNGSDVTVTIDNSMQTLLYGQLEKDKGSSVAMNPNTGEVLALVSTPSYDPNDFVMGMSQEKWDSLNSDPNKPLYNRFQSNAVPGSSFKPITAAIGLDTKTLDPNATKAISGLKWQKDSSWGDYFVTRVSDYGSNTNLLNAMVYSDNIYFAQTALDIGKDKFAEELKKLGFDEDIPFEYGVSTSKFASDGAIKTDVQLADSGYGQGEILINPLHLASIYTMFVNGGNILNPYLEYKATPEAKVWKENAVSKESADTVLNAMTQVVENPKGTGHEAYIDGLKIAAKTGTAEIKASQSDTTGTELGWFIAMTTNKGNKNLLVAVMAEDVKDRGGSHYVIPMVKKALQTVK